MRSRAGNRRRDRLVTACEASGAIVQHDQATRIFLDLCFEDGSRGAEIVISIEHLLDAGASPSLRNSSIEYLPPITACPPASFTRSKRCFAHRSSTAAESGGAALSLIEHAEQARQFCAKGHDILSQLLAVFWSQRLGGHTGPAKPDAFLQGIQIVLKLRLFGKHVPAVNVLEFNVLESGPTE
jgi:hypothetical protein